MKPLTPNASQKIKKTPIGDIPVDWEVRKVSDVGEVQGGRQRSPAFTSGKLRPYLRVANIHDGWIDIDDVLSMRFTDDEFRRYMLKPGDILLNEGQSLELVGRCAIYRGFPGSCCFQNTLIRFCPGDAILSEFAHILFQYQRLTGKFAAIASQTTSIAHLGTSRFASMRLPVPSCVEQRGIVSAIGMWQRATETTEKLLFAKRQLKIGLMQQLLTGKRRFPAFGKNGKDGPHGWKAYHLGELLKEVERPIECNDDTLYHLVSVRRRSGGLFSRESLPGRDILTKDLRVTRTGDFLISKMQVVHGACGLTTTEFDGKTISGSYIALVAKDPSVLDIEFFNYLSQMPFMYHLALVSSYGVHIEKMTFDLNDYLHERIRIPPTIEEQKRITSTLNEANREIRTLERELDALREQKKGLMQKLLTGKVRVKV